MKQFHFPFAVNFDPATHVKVEKNIGFLGTRLKVGGSYNCQMGKTKVWWSLVDTLIGGRISWQGSELAYTKDISPAILDAVNEKLQTRLRFKCGLNLETRKYYGRFGFQTNTDEPPRTDVTGGFPLEFRQDVAKPLRNLGVHSIEDNRLFMEVKSR